MSTRELEHRTPACTGLWTRRSWPAGLGWLVCDRCDQGYLATVEAIEAAERENALGGILTLESLVGVPFAAGVWEPSEGEEWERVHAR